MKVAIVGSGVSGLVCAQRLHAEHEVTVFEAEGRIGGHAHTVDVELDGERHAVDVGFTVYDERSDSAFARILSELAIETQPADMSASVSCERTGFEWAIGGRGGAFSQGTKLVRPAFQRLRRELQRFGEEAARLLDMPEEKASLGEYLLGRGHSDEFVDRYLLPVGAAIGSAGSRDFLEFPAVALARFFANHGLIDSARETPWRVVSGGSQRYVEALAAPFRDRIRLGRPVRTVLHRRRGVELVTGAGELERFDRVILAVHADQALRMLVDVSDAERRALGAFRYRETESVLHTDPAPMPRSRRVRSSWNYRIPTESGSPALVTYHVNRLQGIRSKRPLYVTVNGGDRIDPGRVLARFSCERPVFDSDAVLAQQLHATVDGLRGTHYCGAYWGFGFHEDGVQSALAVCRAFGHTD